jgi:hypothetical protein
MMVYHGEASKQGGVLEWKLGASMSDEKTKANENRKGKECDKGEEIRGKFANWIFKMKGVDGL